MGRSMSKRRLRHLMERAPGRMDGRREREREDRARPRIERFRSIDQNVKRLASERGLVVDGRVDALFYEELGKVLRDVDVR